MFHSPYLRFSALQVYAGRPLLKRALWGVILWLLVQFMVMPMMGGGFFSSQIGGMMAVMGSLISHLVYEATLGGIAGGPAHE